MDRRVEKRHKRKVSRARARVTVTEPDLRTPEQVLAAREASRPDARGSGALEFFPRQQVPHKIRPVGKTDVKTEG